MKKPRINNQITASELRVIGDDGKNIGVISNSDALKAAKERGLDLIEIVPKAKPPVAKIMDYGKFLYKEQKKVRKSKKPQETKTRSMRINIGTSQHDLELKARKISEFLKKGDRVKIDLLLKGRAKYFEKDFIKERINRILHLIKENHKVAEEPKKGHRGISLIIESSKGG